MGATRVPQVVETAAMAECAGRVARERRSKVGYVVEPTMR
jgi:hypothetical protein